MFLRLSSPSVLWLRSFEQEEVEDKARPRSNSGADDLAAAAAVEDGVVAAEAVVSSRARPPRNMAGAARERQR